jgi:hypothetical protein
MWSWSSDAGTDGVVPKPLVSQAAGPNSGKHLAAAITELVKAGVLIDIGHAYQVRDYLDANISKERDEERRAGQVERANRARGNASVTRDRPPPSRVTPEPVTPDPGVTVSNSLDHDHDHEEDHEKSPQRASPDLVTGARPAPSSETRSVNVEALLGREVASLQRHVRRELLAKRDRVPSDLTSSHWTVIAEACRDLVTPTRDLDAVHAQLARDFAASDDPRTAKAGWSIAFLAKNVGQYFGTTAGPSGVSRSGYVRPADSSEHTETSEADFKRALGGGGIP